MEHISTYLGTRHYLTGFRSSGGGGSGAYAQGGAVMLPAELQMAARQIAHPADRRPTTTLLHAATSGGGGVDGAAGEWSGSQTMPAAGMTLPSSRQSSLRPTHPFAKTSPRLVPASQKAGPYQQYPQAAALTAAGGAATKGIGAPLPPNCRPSRPATSLGAHGRHAPDRLDRLLDAQHGRANLSLSMAIPSSAGAAGRGGGLLPRCNVEVRQVSEPTISTS